MHDILIVNENHFLNAWHGRQTKEIAEFLTSQSDSTDVFCFQEAYRNFRHECQKLLPNFTAVAATKFAHPQDNYSQAIYVKNNIHIKQIGKVLASDPEAGLGLFVEIERGNSHMVVCNFHGVPQPSDKLDSPARLRQS